MKKLNVIQGGKTEEGTYTVFQEVKALSDYENMPYQNEEGIVLIAITDYHVYGYYTYFEHGEFNVNYFKCPVYEGIFPVKDERNETQTYDVTQGFNLPISDVNYVVFSKLINFKDLKEVNEYTLIKESILGGKNDEN
ncbi:hypothetical protein OCB01_20060 [Bacillus cereus]|nr:hypothetical protein [Bacillus cereus]